MKTITNYLLTSILIVIMPLLVKGQTMELKGYTIGIDIGHDGKSKWNDHETGKILKYNGVEIYEKDLTPLIGNPLVDKLIQNGATVIETDRANYSMLKYPEDRLRNINSEVDALISIHFNAGDPSRIFTLSYHNNDDNTKLLSKLINDNLWNYLQTLEITNIEDNNSLYTVATKPADRIEGTIGNDGSKNGSAESNIFVTSYYPNNKKPTVCIAEIVNMDNVDAYEQIILNANIRVEIVNKIYDGIVEYLKQTKPIRNFYLPMSVIKSGQKVKIGFNLCSGETGDKIKIKIGNTELPETSVLHVYENFWQAEFTVPAISETFAKKDIRIDVLKSGIGYKKYSEITIVKPFTDEAPNKSFDISAHELRAWNCVYGDGAQFLYKRDVKLNEAIKMAVNGHRYAIGGITYTFNEGSEEDFINCYEIFYKKLKTKSCTISYIEDGYMDKSVIFEEDYYGSQNEYMNKAITRETAMFVLSTVFGYEPSNNNYPFTDECNDKLKGYMTVSYEKGVIRGNCTTQSGDAKKVLQRGALAQITRRAVLIQKGYLQAKIFPCASGTLNEQTIAIVRKDGCTNISKYLFSVIENNQKKSNTSLNGLYIEWIPTSGTITKINDYNVEWFAPDTLQSGTEVGMWVNVYGVNSDYSTYITFPYIQISESSDTTQIVTTYNVTTVEELENAIKDACNAGGCADINLASGVYELNETILIECSNINIIGTNGVIIKGIKNLFHCIGNYINFNNIQFQSIVKNPKKDNGNNVAIMIQGNNCSISQCIFQDFKFATHITGSAKETMYLVNNTFFSNNIGVKAEGSVNKDVLRFYNNLFSENVQPTSFDAGVETSNQGNNILDFLASNFVNSENGDFNLLATATEAIGTGNQDFGDNIGANCNLSFVWLNDCSNPIIPPDDNYIAYPNPISKDEQLTIELKEEPKSEVTYTITSLDGKNISSENVGKQQIFSVDLPKKVGLYLIEIKTNEFSQTKKISVQ